MNLNKTLLFLLLFSNVFMRLFTNKLRLLPKAFNIADVGITFFIRFSSCHHLFSRPKKTTVHERCVGLTGF